MLMRAGIVGASGYLGAELLRLLAGHPELEAAVLQADSSAGEPVRSLYPGLLAAYGDRVLDAIDLDALAACDVVFLAVPAGRSQAIVPGLLAAGAPLVVDLGPDFRLRDPAAYPQWYGFSHEAPELLAEAAFGLVERERTALFGARLIAAPGCYVTAASLALAPLVAAGVIANEGVIVDAASGTSGAGRGLSAATHHAAVNENFSAYKVLSHRHTPEIEQAIGATVCFTPHLAPMTRGILATCYGRLAEPGALSSEEVMAVLEQAYANETFVRVVADLPATRDVHGTNCAHLSARVDPRTGTVVVLSAIDNLTKGGAGQALQAANVALGLPETTGLPVVAVTP
ncbi:MAG: N-acetyl-gamma-glutamyl-phosphate reductase [Actinomycetota bacterium]|nr:N-acetyl-gamma-glutamyl-phosphate reductase [Actinomycetota bacterium]